MNKHKKVPYFWWDFAKGGAVIVESDNDKFKVVGRFHYLGEDASVAIENAEKLIDDLNAGRISMKDAKEKYK